MITNVSSKRFEPNLSIPTDVIAVYKTWLGFIEDSTFNLTLLCDDDSIIIVPKDNLYRFNDISSSKMRRLDKNFYIGQLVMGPLSAFEGGNWIYKSRNMETLFTSKTHRKCKVRAVITNIEMSSISFNWICHIGAQATDLSKEIPSPIITGDDLKNVKPLNVFQKCCHQLNDYGNILIKEEDNLIDFDEWKHIYANRLIEERFHEPYEHESTISGQESCGIDNDSQYYDVLEDFIEHFEASDSSNSDDTCCAKDSVSVKPSIGSLKKIKAKKLKLSKPKRRVAVDLRPGNKVSVQIISTETKVDVIWQDSQCTYNMSSYLLSPVHHLDAHDFFPGDFVIENTQEFSFDEYGVIQDVDHRARLARVKWFKQEIDRKPNFVKEEKLSVYEIKDHSDHQYGAGACVVCLSNRDIHNPLSKAGQVINVLADGKVNCQWADGTQSHVYPQELFVIGEYVSGFLIKYTFRLLT